MIIVLRLRKESPKYLDLNVDLLILPIIAVRQDILFFSPIILHMPLMVDLFYYQSTQNKTEADQYHHCKFQPYPWTTKTYESPRHTSFSSHDHANDWNNWNGREGVFEVERNNLLFLFAKHKHNFLPIKILQTASLFTFLIVRKHNTDYAALKKNSCKLSQHADFLCMSFVYYGTWPTNSPLWSSTCMTVNFWSELTNTITELLTSN